MDAGITWHYRVDQDVNPATGGDPGSGDPGSAGIFAVTVSPNPAYGYAASNPFIGVAGTVINGTAPFTYAWSRAPGGSGDWGGSTGNVGGGNFNCSAPAALTPTFSRTGTADGLVAQNWRLVVTDSLGATAQVILEIALEDDGEVPGGIGEDPCVWIEAYLPDTRQAKEVKVGSKMLVEDLATGEHSLARVSMSKTAYAPCYRLTTENGAVLTCSETAPIGTSVGPIKAPETLGLEVRTLVNGVKSWSKVVEVLPLGSMQVQHITCENNYFFAGDFRGAYIAHHNVKHTPRPDPGTL
jgi:hypothetical protein